MARSVYAVLYSDYDGSRVFKVFETRAKARRYLEQIKESADRDPSSGESYEFEGKDKLRECFDGNPIEAMYYVNRYKLE